jgi:hypothetical protein
VGVVADEPGMLEVTVAIPYLGVVRSRGAGACNEDLAARQGLDVGHRERRRHFEDGDPRRDLRSVPLLRIGSVAVVARDDHSMLASRRRPRRHGDVIGADSDGSRPSRMMARPAEMPVYVSEGDCIE